MEEASEVLRAAGWRVDARFTESPGHARTLARDAAAAGVDIVIAAGGDGTVNEVVNGVAGTDAALAVLPAGTGNVLAAQLGLIGVPTPLHRGDLPAAAAELTRGAVRRVDVGLARSGATSRAFLLWAGVGFDAEVVYELEHEGRPLKDKLGVGAVGALGLRAASSSGAVASVVAGDGWRHRGPLFMAVAANIPLYAGLLEIAHGVRIDDGLLDVVLFLGGGAVDKLRHARAVVTSLTGSRRASVPSSTLRIVSSSPMRVHLDAEPFGHTPVCISTWSKALRLLVPPTAPEELFAAGASVGP
jgi:diacylglycerol kinase family enzyme